MSEKKKPKVNAIHKEYSIELCMEICERVSNGENIKAVLRSETHYPSFVTWCQWKRDHTELLNLYTHAREDKSEDILEQIDEILLKIQAGSIDPSAGRVILDTLKWKAAKFYPKMYGEKLDVTTDGEKLGSEINVVIHEPK